ncbi:MAG: accessory gene regulator B family protein [Bacillota bacterium]|nr:accessory gene regulator B family protein [Bacillota bacterium]
MTLTEKISNKVGIYARSILNVDEEKEMVIVYGAIGLLQIIWSVLWTLAISLIFRVVFEAMLFTIIVSILKKYSGGAHATSPSRCIFIGVTIAIFAGMIIKKFLFRQIFIVNLVLGIVCIFISFLIIAKLAPVDSINKPIPSDKMRKRLNNTSKNIIIFYILLMLTMIILYKISFKIYFLEAYECISLGALWQSITLTNHAIKILNKVDFILSFKNIKRR